jgi:hypothetical protein
LKKAKSQSLIGNKKLKVPFAKSLGDSLDIDFGSCTFGEGCSFYLKISNHGVLPTPFMVIGLDESLEQIKPLDSTESILAADPKSSGIKPEEINSSPLKENDTEHPEYVIGGEKQVKNREKWFKVGKMLKTINILNVVHGSQIEKSKWSVKCGSFEIIYTDMNLKSYNDISLRIIFKPTQKNSDQVDNKKEGQDRTLKNQNEYSKFVIEFPPHLQDITINCKGIGKTMPFFTSRSIIDYHCCIANVLYQDHLFIHNQYRLSRKYSLDFGDEEVISDEFAKTVYPPEFGKITVTPATCFIQAQDYVKLWIKIQLEKRFIKDEVSYTFYIIFSGTIIIYSRSRNY